MTLLSYMGGEGAPSPNRGGSYEPGMGVYGRLFLAPAFGKAGGGMGVCVGVWGGTWVEGRL